MSSVNNTQTVATTERMPQSIISKRALTVSEISDIIGRSKQVVRGVVNEYHGQRQIFIKTWKRGAKGGRITAAYIWGSGDDATKPNPMERGSIERYEIEEMPTIQTRRSLKARGFLQEINDSIQQDYLMAVLFSRPAKGMQC